jgi:hypothetical protein
MINLENLDTVDESVKTIPDMILVDNTYGKLSPDVLSRGVNLALKFGFKTLFLPDLSEKEIGKINEYRITPKDKLKDEINRILKTTYSRDSNVIYSYYKIIESPIFLVGSNLKKSGIFFNNPKQKEKKDEIKNKIDDFRSQGKKVIIFTGLMYNSFLEEVYKDVNDISFLRLRGVISSNK